MKRIDTYITEKLHISNTTKIEYIYHPKDKDELIKCIKEKIKKEGYGTKDNPLNLNDIDTSKIIDMSYLFDKSGGPLRGLSTNGYFDISDWDVSNVTDMSYIFYGSNFNGDISNWDVSNVKVMYKMFWGSDFNGDISNWNVSNVEDMKGMFGYSKFTGKNGDISGWNVRNVEDMYCIFNNCPLQNNPPKWYHE